MIIQRLEVWYKRRHVRFLICFIVGLAVASAIAIGISISANPNTISQTVFTTSTPSVSDVPSMEPSTSPPSLRPTTVPSLTQLPSTTPTMCSLKISKNVQDIQLPLNDPNFIIFELDGKNAVVVAREGETDMVYIVFFLLNESDVWVRNGIFIEEHEGLSSDYFPQHSATIQGNSALVGLPQKNNMSGAVRVFDQTLDGEWQMVPEPLIPEDGGNVGAGFGKSVDLDDDYAVVGAYYEEAIYLFERVDGKWEQRFKCDVGHRINGFYINGGTLVGLDDIMAEINIYKYDHELLSFNRPLLPLSQKYGNTGNTA